MGTSVESPGCGEKGNRKRNQQHLADPPNTKEESFNNSNNNKSITSEHQAQRKLFSHQSLRVLRSVEPVHRVETSPLCKNINVELWSKTMGIMLLNCS